MGCLVERYRDELAQGIPEVAGWFGLAGGPDDRELVRMLARESPASATPEAGRAAQGALRPASADAGGPRAPGVGSRCPSFAYVKISDGCDESCTFCAIPGIKGPYHAARPEEILREAGACLTEGAKELVLVGQDTARWQSGGHGSCRSGRSAGGRSSARSGSGSCTFSPTMSPTLFSRHMGRPGKAVPLSGPALPALASGRAATHGPSGRRRLLPRTARKGAALRPGRGCAFHLHRGLSRARPKTISSTFSISSGRRSLITRVASYTVLRRGRRRRDSSRGCLAGSLASA